MYRFLRKFIEISLFFAAVFLFFHMFLPLFLPFFLGALLSLTAEPMVSFLSERIPRPLGTAIGITSALCFLVLALAVLLAVTVRELTFLAGLVPDLEQAATQGMSALSQWTLGLLSRLPSGIQRVLEPGILDFFSGSSAVLDQAFRYLLSITGGILRQVPDSALVLGTSVISAYMISAKLPAIRKAILDRIPKERLRKLRLQWEALRDALLGWLKAQFKLMGISFTCLTLGFILLRIRYAPLAAGLTALVDAFPILGTGTVLIPWSILSMARGETARAIGLLGCYAAVALSRSILEPKLLGSHLGLDPLVTLAALYAGYRLWGLGGMLLAPLLTVLAAQLLRSREVSATD